MRILYHHRTLGDGAEGVHIASMVESFRGLGHEVMVASIIGEETNVSTSKTRILTPLTRYLPRSAYELAELSYSLAGLRMLKQRIRAFRPHFVYERYTLYNFAGVRAARWAGIPLILEVNAPLALERQQYETLAFPRLARGCERRVADRASLVFAVSSPLRDYLVREGTDAAKVHVLPNGVNPDVFRPDADARRLVRGTYGIPENATVVGFCGILRPWHGVDLLFRAVAPLLSRFPALHLLIVGDGPSRASLETLGAHLGISALVTITGRVPHEEVPRILAAMDIGVSPRATFYASPMKVLEYMATDVAVVAPNSQNLRDLIADGVTGMLFRPEDEGSLTETLRSLIDDDTLLQSVRRQARKDVLEHRTWRLNAETVIRCARAVLPRS